MSLNFPSNPSLNDTYTIGGRTYIFNGQGWELTSTPLITDNIPEGTLKYFTNARVYANVVEVGFATPNDLVVKANVADLTTANVSESTNLYFTNARVVTAVENTTLSTLRSNILTVSNSTISLGYYLEKSNVISSGMSANVSYNVADGVVHYHTASASANSTINIQGLSGIPTGNTLTVAILNTNGATAYKVNSVQIDGTATNVTVRWSGGAAPTQGYASNIDVYTLSILKTAALTYTVLGNQTNFGG